MIQSDETLYDQLIGRLSARNVEDFFGPMARKSLMSFLITKRSSSAAWLKWARPRSIHLNTDRQD